MRFKFVRETEHFKYYLRFCKGGIHVVEVPPRKILKGRILKRGRLFLSEERAMKYLNKYIEQGGHFFPKTAWNKG